MVVQSIAEYEQTKETIVMLQLTALDEKEIAEGKTLSAKETFAQIRNKMGLASELSR